MHRSHRQKAHQDRLARHQQGGPEGAQHEAQVGGERVQVAGQAQWASRPFRRYATHRVLENFAEHDDYTE